MRERSGGSCVLNLAAALIAATGLFFLAVPTALAGSAPGVGPDTIGCFEPSLSGAGGVWYLRGANSSGPADQWTLFGAVGTTFTPVVGRWLDSTPVTGLGLYEQVNGTLGRFHVKDDPNTSGVADGFTDLAIEPTSSATTPPIPLAGGFGGADAPGVGFYYPDDGTFVIDDNPGSASTVTPFLFGPVNAGSIFPLVGDWDGDGTDTVGVYDSVSGNFYLTNALTGGDVTGFQFGPPAPGWIPVAGNWDLSGGDSVGLFDPANALFRLKNSNDESNGGQADILAYYGVPGGDCQPVVGNWNITPP